MANVIITPNDNEIQQIKKRGSSTTHYLKDDAARNALSNVQVSLDDNYESTETILGLTSPSGGDSFQTAIHKLHTGLLIDETVISQGLNNLNMKLNQMIPDFSKTYFTIEPLANGTITFSVSGLSYSIDLISWQSLGTTALNVVKDQNIYLKGNMTPNSTNGIGTLSATANINVSGNIMSLLFGDNFIGQDDLTGKTYAFYNLFADNTYLINAKNLILPAITLDNYCYSCMFIGCSSLISAPKLPATTLAEGCYVGMFATCTSLTTAPELPATILVKLCYGGIFLWCSSLNYIKCLATDISATDCTDNWVSGVATSGTFIKADNNNYWAPGDDGIPSGWNVYIESEAELAHKYDIQNIDHISKTAGTSAPGTLDTYTIYDNKNSVIGTFGVYNGNDGVSCSHSWNGTSLTITSASGSSSANLKGDTGDGIKAIQRTSGNGSAGTIDTYTMYSDTGKTNSIGTFSVYNGSNGTNGSAATISVGTVTTLSPSSNATVTNGGSSSAAILNFGIPQGAHGSSIWTANANPTTPNYTFTISSLVGPSDQSPQIGDIILRSYYRYTITSISDTTVLGELRTSMRGSQGATGATGATGANATTTSIFSSSENGLAPASSSTNQAIAESTVGNYYLCSDGKWRQLPSTAFSGDTGTDTTYKLTVNGVTYGDSTSGTNLGTIYAPTSAGTSGQILSSNGAGAPKWTSLPNVNDSGTIPATFYAPTSAGTSGQILSSNGTGAPTWINNEGGTDTKVTQTNTTSSTSTLYLLFSKSASTSTLTEDAYKCSNVKIVPAYARLTAKSYVCTGYTSDTTTGAISINARNGDLHIITLTGNVSGITITNAVQYQCITVLLYSSSTARTVTIAHSSTYICPNAQNLSLTIPAGGYCEVSFIAKTTTTFFVRGV